MGRPYSLDLRERVVSAMNAGMSGQKAADHFSIGKSSALRWARRARATGSPKAKPMGDRARERLSGLSSGFCEFVSDIASLRIQPDEELTG